MSRDLDPGGLRTEGRSPHVPGADRPVTAGERWLARLAFLLAAAAVAVVVIAGVHRPGVIVIGVVGLALTLAAAWWVVSNRGTKRWLAAAVAVAVPVGLVVAYVVMDRLWEIVVVLGLTAGAAAAGRAALVRARPPTGMPEHEAKPAVRPYLIMNPRSGGGKVGRFGLVEKAQHLGAEVALLDGPGEVDVAALARHAVDDGADLLGVAGGDGTQALVAGIAAEHGLPFVVISAGTRNHFAMDLGLDRDRPDRSLDALTEGVEVVLDLGRINGRVFVNNASFGAYAAVVQSPAYRDDKVGTTLQMLPDLLAGHRGPRLRVRIDGEQVIEAPTALLVSNNPYGTGDPAGLGRRGRIDTGRLGVVAVTVRTAGHAASLLAGRRGPGLSVGTAREVVVESDAAQIPVGVDGEALLLPTPVRCTIQPAALRVRLPRSRPGVPQVRPPLDLALLRRQALSLGRPARPAG